MVVPSVNDLLSFTERPTDLLNLVVDHLDTKFLRFNVLTGRTNIPCDLYNVLRRLYNFSFGSLLVDYLTDVIHR